VHAAINGAFALQATDGCFQWREVTELINFRD
jgi:hypothetical protein